MTQQVRKSYRNHRKRAWALALMAVVAVAAVVIPIASGAPDKTYSLSIAPSTVCSSIAEGGASALLTLKNTAKTVTLGSAENLLSGRHALDESLVQAGLLSVS